MAITAYKKTALTGGAAGALDSIDGAGLLDGDFAFVTLATISYIYILDDDSAAAESSPDVISPDANAGDKRWILLVPKINVGSDADGDMYYRASSKLTRLAKGTANQILGMNAGATAPEYKTLKVLSTGEMTNTSQPCFQAESNATQSNIAVGVTTTVVFASELFDQGGDFAANTFTAPVTGKYLLTISIGMSELDTAASWYLIRITTSNRSYSHLLEISKLLSADGFYRVNMAMVADMDAADQAIVTVQQTGGGQQTDLSATNFYPSKFSGCLLC
jgi:hypothetical protein